MLKDAILHGAKLGKAKKELEDQVAEQHAEQQRLQRRLTQLNQEAMDVATTGGGRLLENVACLHMFNLENECY